MAQVDREAQDALFMRLFETYRRPIVNYLYRLLGDADDAEEVCQDVFVKAYRALPRLSIGTNHRAWLYRIASNAATDIYRRRRLIRWVRLGRDEREDRGPMARPDLAVPEATCVRKALERLPIKYRQVLVLFSVEGYSVREISEMVGASEGAVKVRLHRARERFRAVYQEDSVNALP